MQSLVPLHTFSLNSFAQQVVEITSVDELKAALISLQSQPYLILGEGSNTIFIEDYAGTIVRIMLKGINLKHTDERFFVSIAAGENWHALVLWCLEHRVFGLENLALIPGTVGAAPIQNIGAYGLEIGQFVQHVEYLDLSTYELKFLKGEDCHFAYRDSIFKNELLGKAIITGVTLSLPKAWQSTAHYGELKALLDPTPASIFNEVVAVRQRKLPDPVKLGNAGSFFKNPIISNRLFETLKQQWPAMPSYPVDDYQVKVPAAWLIDTLGFKGKKIGGITCHNSQPLVLTNNGTGTGQELLLLARDIRNKVQQVFAITLENEVRLINKNGPMQL